MIDYVYENNFLDSSRETGKAAILKMRQTRGISTKSLEIYAVFDWLYKLLHFDVLY